MIAELFDMSAETALVTGGGSGLGKRFAQTLASAGATVILSGRRPEKLEDTAAAINGAGGRAHAVTMDVSDMDSVGEAIEQCMNISPLTVLVNNAGTVSGKMLLDMAEGDWDGVINTNLKGAWSVAVEVARRMINADTEGSIVNIASVLGSSVQMGTGAYCASKAGLLQLTRQMALEWAGQGVRVNAIAPGYYMTDISADYLESEIGKRLLRKIPLRRLGDPSELDAALLMLASGASGYMTGSVVTVDGGLSMAVV